MSGLVGFVLGGSGRPLRLPCPLRCAQIAVKRKRVAIRIVEGELARSPRRIAHTFAAAVNLAAAELSEEGIRVVNQESQTDCAHLMLMLKLHVQLDRITPEADVVLWFRLVIKRQSESQLLRVEGNRTIDVAGADDRVGFFEHSSPPRLAETDSMEAI